MSEGQGSIDSLQQLLECVSEEKYKEAAKLCQSLLVELNKQKGSSNGSLKVAVSELLARIWLHLEKYSKIQEFSWEKDTSAITKQHLQLYAQYRMKNYGKVALKLSSSSSSPSSTQEQDRFERLLLAQCLFNESRMSEAGSVYQDLLTAHDAAKDAAEAGGDCDEDEEDTEYHMELLTNLLAVLVADATPYTIPTLGNKEGGGGSNAVDTQACISAAVHLLEDPATNQYYYDLGSNLGTYECATSCTTSGGGGGGKSWLDEAYRHCQLTLTKQDEKVGNEAPSWLGEVSLILANMMWSRQWKGSFVDETKVLSHVKQHGTPVTKAITSYNDKLFSWAHGAGTENENSEITSHPSMLFLQNKDLQAQTTTSWTPLQVRLFWYNRAIVYLRAGQWDQCRQACQSLRDTWSKAPAKQAKDSTNYVPLGTEDETAWWETRCDVILAHAMWNSRNDESSKKDDNWHWEEATKILQTRLGKLPASAESALVQVQLHLHYFRCLPIKRLSESQVRQTTIDLLEGLPSSMVSCKAVIATLASLYSKGEEESGGANSTDSAFFADSLLSQGNYEAAAAMYEKVLPATVKGCTPEQIQEKLRHVQALSHVNPKKAQELWKEVNTHVRGKKSSSTDESESLDGESLESRELPRSTTLATSSLETGTIVDDTNRSNTKNKEPVMRRRARKREEYLKALAGKGLYNPDRPSKPNPDRWIPKYARGSAYNKKRGGGGYNKGTQGGGADADVAKKLDAAARKAGGAESSSSSAPSTANIKIASGGGRKGGRRR